MYEFQCPMCNNKIQTDLEQGSIQCPNCFENFFRIKLENVNKEICICAAVRAEDGTIIRGQTHRDCRDGIIRRNKKITTNLEDEGFITSTGRFVNRKEGFELMKAIGWKSMNPQGYQLCGLLFSEDLY